MSLGRSLVDLSQRVTAAVEGRAGKRIGTEIRFLCPSHEDASPSADWNPEKGVWTCRVCGAGGGVVSLAEALGIGRPEKIERPAKPVTEEEVEARHKVLVETPEAMSFLFRERHAPAEVVKRFRLGLVSAGENSFDFFYPIRTPEGLFPSARRYLPHRPKGKRRFWSPAFSQIEPRPRVPIFGLVEALEAGEWQKWDLVLCEGEDKALALAAWGLPAIALTAGIGTWNADWSAAFAAKRVLFVPDTDPSGLGGISLFRGFMEGARAAEIGVVKLPLPGTPEMKDVTDWIGKARGTAEDLISLLDGVERETIEAPAETVPPAGPSGKAPVSGKRSGLTDWGNAERMTGMSGEDIRYVHPWEKWLVWDGVRWKQDETAEIMRIARSVVEGLHEEAGRVAAEAMKSRDEAEREKILARAEAVKGWAIKSEAKGRIEAMVGLAASEPGVPIPPDTLDREESLFNVANGTLDLATGKLRRPERLDYLSKSSPIVFEADAKCPTWERFLCDVMDARKNLIDYLRRVVGYAMTGSTREQVIFFFYGCGANGKSTFLETILKVMGEYGKQAAPDLLMSKEKQHPTELADLAGARFVTTIEVGEGRKMAEALVKQLTGSDTMTVRRMYENFWSFRPTHKLFLAANHKPVIVGTDEAIWRRIRMVPWVVRFSNEGGRKPDPNLAAKLTEEMPGILAWAVRGAKEWRESGLGDPPEVLSATRDYRSEMDSIMDFLQTECVQVAGANVKSSALFERFEAWHKKMIGGTCMTGVSFSRKLSERGFIKERASSGMFWKNLGLCQNEIRTSD